MRSGPLWRPLLFFGRLILFVTENIFAGNNGKSQSSVKYLRGRACQQRAAYSGGGNGRSVTLRRHVQCTKPRASQGARPLTQGLGQPAGVDQ